MRAGETITAEAIERTGAYPVYGGNGLRGYTSAKTHTGTRILIGRQGALCGNVHLVDGEFWASEHAIVVHARDGVDPRWCAHLLRVMNLGQYSQTVAQPGIGTAQVSALEVPVPPTDEQRAIADFLDRETARIDTLIEEQQRLIDLLRERRAAVITCGAVEGIDHAPLVDSGNVYLGAVPVHWTVGRFSRDVAINGGQVDPREDPWADMVLVAPNHIEGGTGAIVGRETAREQGADSGKYVATAGQLLYSKIRPALNKVAVADEDCLTSADMYAISSRKGDDHRYLLYYMLARPFHTFATLTSQRVKMPKINREELGEAPWLRPPFDEQRRIVACLDEQTSKIDTLIAETERFIELARERRSALITAAVTGQIDVREVA
ncbi:restriction endonuclease subunit S [Mycolicibacterium conceptionense]|nr:restriction endonuclease subunit S [Mycolicibacterium conceptionense]